MNQTEIITKVLVPFNFAANTNHTAETVGEVLDEPLSNYLDSLEFHSFIMDVETEFGVDGIHVYQESVMGSKKFTLRDVIGFLEKSLKNAQQN